MASPYIMTNADLSYLNLAGQQFNLYIAFLNPVSFTTNWVDLAQDATGNWLAPPNVDTAATHIQPYAPICNLGSNRIGFVGEALYFDGSRSYQRHDVPVVSSSYIWSVTGPNHPTLYSNASQLGVVWDSPGLYEVVLQVSDLAGTQTTSTRQVMIYQDRPSALPGIISLSGLSGSLSGGGWSCQVTTVSSQVSLYPPDALAVGTYQPIVIMVETSWEVSPDYWVNRTIGPHGQFSPGYPYQDPRILFDGYIQNGTIHQDVDKDTLSFSCAGPQMILQDIQCHTLGYYNTTYTSVVNGVPTGCNPSPAGTGYLVGNLMTVDVVHSLLLDHSNVGQYHDIHCWNPNIPTNPYFPGSPIAYYNLIYTNISINTGTIWTNLQDILGNEYSMAYCERDGSLRVGPQINLRGGDYWNQPTLLGPEVATTLINFIQDLGFGDVGTNLATMGQNVPVLPALPFPIILVHPWGNQPNPPQVQTPFGTTSPEVIVSQQQLTGPPLLCTFSDIPVYDQADIPPADLPLYPWIQYNWPQDLAIYPISFDVPEQYTSRTSLVKLIGDLVNASTTWTCWYPQTAFSTTPSGEGEIQSTTLPAGNWYLQDHITLPDATKAQNGTLLSNWWWELARRIWYNLNVVYQCTITLGMFTACSLSDLIGVTRQNNSLGPNWSAKPFYVNQIDHSIDMTARTWTTVLSTTEITSAAMGPIQPPPQTVPKH